MAALLYLSVFSALLFGGGGGGVCVGGGGGRRVVLDVGLIVSVPVLLFTLLFG